MSDIVTIELTSAQQNLLAPIVNSHSKRRLNCLFIASASPNTPHGWRLEVVSFPATRARKVLKVIRDAAELPVAAVDAPVQARKSRRDFFYTP